MKRLFQALNRLYPRIELTLTTIGAWLIVALMFFTVIAVLARYLARKPIGAAMDLTELAVPTIVFLGLAYTLKKGMHLNVTILVDKLPGQWKRGAQVLALLALFCFFALIVWYGSEFAWRAISIGDTTTQGYPTWPAKIMVPIGSVFICIRAAIEIIKLLGGSQSGMTGKG